MTTQGGRPFFVSFEGANVDDRVRDLVDRCYTACRQMIKTHHEEDILATIKLAQELETLGYTMLWFPYKHTVGARRKSDGYIVTSDGTPDKIN